LLRPDAGSAAAALAGGRRLIVAIGTRFHVRITVGVTVRAVRSIPATAPWRASAFVHAVWRDGRCASRSAAPSRLDGCRPRLVLRYVAAIWCTF
jgi:hypothetical protein